MISVSAPLASSSCLRRSKPPWMRSFCAGGAALAQAVMPGAWLTAQAKLIGILFSANGIEVIGLRHLVQQRERSQQQAMHPHGIEPPHVHVDQGRALVRREIVAVREPRSRLEIRVPAGR